MFMALFVCTTKQHYAQSHWLAKQDDACHTHDMYVVMLLCIMDTFVFTGSTEVSAELHAFALALELKTVGE